MEDLKAACAEASTNSEINDFEVGVFCGKYKTEVPEGYFEHLNELRGKKRKIAGMEEGALTGNSGPVGIRGSRSDDSIKLELRDSRHEEEHASKLRSPEHREDIRYAPRTL